MKREDIISMAREAGFIAPSMSSSFLRHLERFAALVAAAEREAFAAGVQGLFEADELRRVVGFEPLQNDGMPTEGGAPSDA